MAEWLAVGVGLLGGVLATYHVASRALPAMVERSARPLLATRLAFAGTVVTVLPALLLSMVVGAPLGALAGTLGIVAGVAAVFAVVVLAGMFAGVLLGRILTRGDWRG